MSEAEELSFYEDTLNQAERDAIVVALASDTPWSHERFDNPIKANLASAKQKIKTLHFEKTGGCCCYCRHSLQDRNIETDREHIVPKSLFSSLSYNIFNLSVSCKRCNMTYKGETLAHLIDPNTIDLDLRNPDRYLIPHPNIDNYEDHIKMFSVNLNGVVTARYKRITPKGFCLFELFKLDRLCVNDLDLAQGGEVVNEEIAEIFSFPTEGS